MCVVIGILTVVVSPIGRNSFWPGGVLAESAPERAADVKIRTRVTAKTKMYGSIPGGCI